MIQNPKKEKPEIPEEGVELSENDLLWKKTEFLRMHLPFMMSLKRISRVKQCIKKKTHWLSPVIDR